MCEARPKTKKTKKEKKTWWASKSNKDSQIVANP